MDTIRCVVVSALLLEALLIQAVFAGETSDFCPPVYAKAQIHLPFNPAFLHVQRFNGPDGGRHDGLLMSSFYNVEKNPEGTAAERFRERDLVALIRDVGGLETRGFRAERDLQVISDVDAESPRQVWPNETSRVPDGVLPFEGVVSPQGFQVAPKPGRLSIINLDDPELTEFIVDQSSFQPPTLRVGQRGQPAVVLPRCSFS